MEEKLQITNQTLSTPLNDKEFKIATAIFHINQLVAYPLSDSQIEQWAKSINRLLPELLVDDLEKLMDLMKIGEIEYDQKQGIQNIFLGLRRVKEINKLVDPNMEEWVKENFNQNP